LIFDLEKKEETRIDYLPHKEYVPQKLEFGLIISAAPSPFSKTIFVSIVPRYLVLNKLGVPVVLKQKNQSGIPTMRQLMMKNQQIPYNF